MLAYTAELKNPMNEPFEQKAAKVEQVLQQLGLVGCRGVRIGSQLARGISGAQPCKLGHFPVVCCPARAACCLASKRWSAVIMRTSRSRASRAPLAGEPGRRVSARPARCAGGQCKRVNIGIALVTNPRVLFLDEPTSGLDSYTSNEVMTVVKGLTRTGITICATIHNPTPYCFNLFDRLMILLHGRVVYSGENGAPPARARLCGCVRCRLGLPAACA